MTDTPDFRMETYIHCTQDALWDALTSAEANTQFNFMASKVERDGNALIYYTPDGSEMLICTETTLDPKSRISSTFEPRWDATIPASRFDYLITPEGEYCRLTLEHFDLNFPVVEGEGVADGWVRTLAGLKTWLETGKSIKYMDRSETND